MELIEIRSDEYETLCKKCQYFYNSKNFHEINRNKVENVIYLLFKEKRNKMLLAAGIKEGMMQIPYSAPFAVFEVMQSYIRIEEIDAALKLLDDYAIANHMNGIFFRCPPTFYDCSFLSKLHNSMLRNDYQIEECDLNYQFRLTGNTEYRELLHRNARKNLNHALGEDLQLFHCNQKEEKEEAYHIIAANRKGKGYTLRMTYEQIMNTVQYTNHDFFLLKNKDISVASAIIFQVTKNCYQVIYWGNIEEAGQVRPMNYMAYRLYSYYLEKGIEFLDIGPSTENGVPNYGLCEFKESIGCEVASKYTFVKKYEKKENLI